MDRQRLLLSLSALFAFRGRLADIAGHRTYTERAGRRGEQLFELVKHDFALSTRTVFYVMAGLMALTFLLSLVAMPAGRAEALTPA